MFELDARLKADTVEIARLDLSLALLMNDRALPWLILVPRRENLRELHDLCEEDRTRMIEEIALASRVLESAFRPDKLNIGVLGNLVSQLHVHVVGRFKSDRAWPGPIWGSAPPQPYGEGALRETLTVLREAFAKG